MKLVIVLSRLICSYNMTSPLGSLSSESPQQELKKDMECIDNKSKGKIIPRDHRQYKACLQNNPITKIVIPNSLYYNWEAKIKLEKITLLCFNLR